MASREEQVHRSLIVEKRELPARLDADYSSLARRRDAIIFLREFTRELRREISPLTKIIILLCLTALLGGVIYLGRAAYIGYRTEQQKHLNLIDAQGRRIDEHAGRIESVKKLADDASQQISTLTQTGTDLKQTTERINERFSLASNLWNSYNAGVCLIAGSYIFVDPSTNRPLRYPEEDMSDAERMLTRGTEVPLTTEGDGPIFELQFVGTGFHVGDGYVLTNNHVVSQPWIANEHAQLIVYDTGARPKLKKLLAFFPYQHQAFNLNFKSAARGRDLAVCRLDKKGERARIPTLPLEHDSGATAVGKDVLMMGYPTGPDRLLALLPEKEALGLQKEFGASLFVLLGELERRRLIKPLTTQGHITDLYRDKIVFDAEISDGSSGAPMFGEGGRVIGVAFAMFIENRASNFAVPIRDGIKLLKRAGWAGGEVPFEKN